MSKRKAPKELRAGVTFLGDSVYVSVNDEKLRITDASGPVPWRSMELPAGVTAHLTDYLRNRKPKKVQSNDGTV